MALHFSVSRTHEQFGWFYTAGTASQWLSNIITRMSGSLIFDSDICNHISWHVTFTYATKGDVWISLQNCNRIATVQRINPVPCKNELHVIQSCQMGNSNKFWSLVVTWNFVNPIKLSIVLLLIVDITYFWGWSTIDLNSIKCHPVKEFDDLTFMFPINCRPDTYIIYQNSVTILAP